MCVILKEISVNENFDCMVIVYLKGKNQCFVNYLLFKWP